MRTWQLVIVMLLTRVHAGFADVSVSLDESNRFLLHGEGEQLLGIEFRSPSGSLVPDIDESASPFSFLVSNTPSKVTYGNLGNALTLNGTVALDSGWDSTSGIRDITAAWGDGPNVRDAILHYGRLPNVGVSVNAGGELVLSGQGESLTELTFTSRSGSLRPATGATPFENLAVNTNEEIRFLSPSGVKVDGDLTLGVGWSSDLFTRDVRYSYQLDSSEQLTGPSSIAHTDYAYELPEFDPLRVHVNEDLRFVISGDGQPVSKFKLFSSASSLTPSADSSPFSELNFNSSSHIELVAPQGLVIDGDVVLETKWSPSAQPDVRVVYDLLGDLTGGRLQLTSQDYPTVPDHVRLGVEPILVTLDDQNRFVITGNGQQIRGIEFKSNAGVLVPGGLETAPFPHVLSNTENNITLGILGEDADITGSFTMDFGVKSAADLADVTIGVGYGKTIVEIEPNFVCNECSLPTAALSEGGGILIENAPELVTEIRIASTLVPLNELVLPDGIEADQVSEQELVLRSETGFGQDVLRNLSLTWARSQDEAVFVSFTLSNGPSFGPLPLSLASQGLVPEPSASWLFLIGAMTGLLGRVRRPRQRMS